MMMIEHGRNSPPVLRMLLGAVLALTVLLLAGCSHETLYAHLDEQQANEVIGALLQDGIDADKQPSEHGDGWEVLVDKRDLPRATALLTAQGLPQQKLTTLCDVFKEQGFVSSPIEDKARYRCALDQDIANTLRKLDGVIDASVQVAIPDKDPLAQSQQSASASVVIVALPNSLVLQRETDVKAIVKDAVDGLTQPDQITVKFAVREPVPGAQAAGGKPVAISGMRGSDLGPVLLTVIAAMAVLVALLLLWRGRVALRGMIGARRVLPRPGAGGGHER